MDYDLLVIGGGINGCSIAAEAASRGLKVILCEKGDLASGTSSASSNLIHGGLRYLEQYQFSLVQKALKEREILLNVAPHLIEPLPFILPYHNDMRPYWMLRLGLFLYDHLAKTSLPSTKGLSRTTSPEYFAGLKDNYQRGFRYYDAWTNDARLVIANAQQAKSFGATIFTNTAVTKTTRDQQNWTVHGAKPKGDFTFTAKAIVNATGPWIDSINAMLNVISPYALSLVKGSHIITQQLYPGDHAYILQNTDKRVIFAIPYAKNYTLIGTTDVSCDSQLLGQPKISKAEIHYLVEVISRYFKKSITPEMIVSSYSGIRPLVRDNNQEAKDIGRDYKLHIDTSAAPIVSVYGGKITTYRSLSVACVNLLKPFFSHITKSISHTHPLPGGDIKDIDSLMKSVKKTYPWLPPELGERYGKTYGNNIFSLLNNCKTIKCLGQPIAETLYEKEIAYLMEFEWAKSVDDILLRRTKLGNVFTEKQRAQCENYFANFIQN